MRRMMQCNLNPNLSLAFCFHNRHENFSLIHSDSHLNVNSGMKRFLRFVVLEKLFELDLGGYLSLWGSFAPEHSSCSCSLSSRANGVNSALSREIYSFVIWMDVAVSLILHLVHDPPPESPASGGHEFLILTQSEERRSEVHRRETWISYSHNLRSVGTRDKLFLPDREPLIFSLICISKFILLI